MLLMMIPGKQEHNREEQVQQPVQIDTESNVEEQLAQILSRVSGAGQVKVMLSIEKGEQTIYQTDSDDSESENSIDHRSQTILITDSSRNEKGLIHQKIPPSYKGAIILAQGADEPTVKLALVDAVSNITGLGTDKISVLKMQ
jgi:stage III sporulation protein AG